MGCRFLEFASEAPEAVRVSTVDVNSVALDTSKYDQVEFFLDVKQMVRSTKPNVVVISSPAPSHLELGRTVRAMEPECALLIEKPLLDTPLDDEDLRWCVENQHLVSVGYNWRHHPQTKRLSALKESESGDIKHLWLHVASDIKRWPGKQYVDPLREFSHELDLVTHLVNGPRLHDVDQRSDGRYDIVGTHSNGTWRVTIAPFSKIDHRWVKVVTRDGSKTTFQWDTSEATLRETYRDEFIELCAHRAGGLDFTSLTCPLMSAVQTTLLIDAIERRLNTKLGRTG
jgi:predicted dehydrogenase